MTTNQEHSEDIEDLTAELKRREVGANLMAKMLAQKVETETLLGGALNTATVLIDQLMTEMHLANVTPSQGLILAHGNFVIQMQRLIGKAHGKKTIIANEPSYTDRADPDGETPA